VDGKRCGPLEIQKKKQQKSKGVCAVDPRQETTENGIIRGLIVQLT